MARPRFFLTRERVLGAPEDSVVSCPGGAAFLVGDATMHSSQPRFSPETGEGQSPMIRHNAGPGIGKPAEAPEPAAPKIRAFDQKLGAGHTDEQWKRTPAQTGQGAVHCRTFHCKLSEDAVANMDRQINEWLDAHPTYEVKLVTSTVGEWQGKLREPQMIVQVWV